MTDQLLRGRELDVAVRRCLYPDATEGISDFHVMANLAPRYHEDDNACMGVVRELQSRGYTVAIHLMSKPVESLCRVGSPGPRDPLAPETCVLDKDDRVAILNAVLRAVRKERGDG